MPLIADILATALFCNLLMAAQGWNDFIYLVCQTYKLFSESSLRQLLNESKDGYRLKLNDAVKLIRIAGETRPPIDLSAFKEYLEGCFDNQPCSERSFESTMNQLMILIGRAGEMRIKLDGNASVEDVVISLNIVKECKALMDELRSKAIKSMQKIERG